jgi:acyl carrier protein
MTEAEALAMIKTAADDVTPGTGAKLSLDTHLQKDGIFDSLDMMNFMFELEHHYDKKIEQVTEDFDDYRVSTLVAFMTQG